MFLHHHKHIFVTVIWIKKYCMYKWQTMKPKVFTPLCVLQQAAGSELSGSIRALQRDLEELRSVNVSLRKENQSLREQLNSAKNGDWNIQQFVSERCSLVHLLTLTSFYSPSGFRRGCTWAPGASQLWCRVCSCFEGFLPQHDLSQGSAAAPAQTQAQCTSAASELQLTWHRTDSAVIYDVCQHHLLYFHRPFASCRRSRTCSGSGCLWTSRVVCWRTSRSSWSRASPHSNKTLPPSFVANENGQESGLNFMEFSS